jgi:hypothetical protein
LNQILKRQTSRFHYGSKVPAITITVFITILEQNRWNSCQSSTKFSEVNVKNTLTSHIDKKIFLTFLLTFLSLYIFTIWKCTSLLKKMLKDNENPWYLEAQTIQWPTFDKRKDKKSKQVSTKRYTDN